MYFLWFGQFNIAGFGEKTDEYEEQIGGALFLEVCNRSIREV